MNPRIGFRALAGTLVIVFASLAFMTAGSSAAKHKNVYWLDLGGQSSIAPHFVFFTADAGGYMSKVHWKHWGKKKTVGKGRWGVSGPCHRGCEGRARLILRKPVKCHPAFGNKKGKAILVYRHGRINYPGGGKRIVTNISGRTGWGAFREA